MGPPYILRRSSRAGDILRVGMTVRLMTTFQVAERPRLLYSQAWPPLVTALLQAAAAILIAMRLAGRSARRAIGGRRQIEQCPAMLMRARADKSKMASPRGPKSDDTRFRQVITITSTPPACIFDVDEVAWTTRSRASHQSSFGHAHMPFPMMPPTGRHRLPCRHSLYAADC